MKIASLFGQIQISVVLYPQSFKYSLSSIQQFRGITLQQLLLSEENFFQEKEKISVFLADSTSVIRKIERQKTFGEGPWSVCNTIHAFDITNTGIGYACKCEKILNGNEKTFVQRLTHKAYQFCNSKQI